MQQNRDPNDYGKKKTKRKYVSYYTIYMEFWIYKLIYSDRKQTSLGGGGVGQRDYKVVQINFPDDRYAHFLLAINSFLGIQNLLHDAIQYVSIAFQQNI